jgi:sn-1 stearoyl-lipid 9-desaturase
MAPSVDPKGRRRDWTVTIAIATLHVLCLAAPFCFSWSGLAVMAIMWWVGGGLGITLCYHRLLTHRSFTTPKWFEYLLAIIGTINWQGGPIRWVGTHRIHHKYSDKEGDPHTPRHGFAWSHMFWVCYRDHASQNPYDAAKDLQRDKGLVFIDKYFPVFQFGFAAILFGLGYAFGATYGGSGHGALYYATSWLIWGTAVRAVFGYHATWFVNSASHVWGYQNFNTHDDSRNNWWVALLSFGEGWHNNHHAQQRSAAHGMKWWEFDMTWWTIRALSWVGLARDIVYPKVPQSGTKGAQSDSNPVVDSSGNMVQEASAE